MNAIGYAILVWVISLFFFITNYIGLTNKAPNVETTNTMAFFSLLLAIGTLLIMWR